MRLPKNLFTGTYTKPKIFLCETDKQKIGVLNTTDTKVSLKFNTYSELSFNIDRTYIDILTGNKNTNLFYDRIEHPRLILLDNIGYFQIQDPDMSSDGFRESKTIVAYSSEYALSQKYITDLHINTGEVDSVEVREALKEPVNKIVDEIKRVFQVTPPELAADIIERGIVMAGGGSMLKGLKDLIKDKTGVPVLLVEKPLESVAKGAGEAFELFREMSSSRSVYENLND